MKKLVKSFNKDDTGVTAENKEKYIGFNVKINIMLLGVTIEDSKEVPKNIELRFIDNCRFMVSSLAKPDSGLNDDQCKTLRILQGRQSE